MYPDYDHVAYTETEHPLTYYEELDYEMHSYTQDYSSLKDYFEFVVSGFVRSDFSLKFQTMAKEAFAGNPDGLPARETAWLTETQVQNACEWLFFDIADLSLLCAFVCVLENKIQKTNVDVIRNSFSQHDFLFLCERTFRDAFVVIVYCILSHLQTELATRWTKPSIYKEVFANGLGDGAWSCGLFYELAPFLPYSDMTFFLKRAILDQNYTFVRRIPRGYKPRIGWFDYYEEDGDATDYEDDADDGEYDGRDKANDRRIPEINPCFLQAITTTRWYTSLFDPRDSQRLARTCEGKESFTYMPVF